MFNFRLANFVAKDFKHFCFASFDIYAFCLVEARSGQTELFLMQVGPRSFWLPHTSCIVSIFCFVRNWCGYKLRTDFHGAAVGVGVHNTVSSSTKWSIVCTIGHLVLTVSMDKSMIPAELALHDRLLYPLVSNVFDIWWLTW